MRALASYVVVFVVSFFLLCQFSAGQAVYGNINGTISDKSGAAVSNATITVTDLDRGTTYQVKANESGNYEQTHLLAGHYKVSVAAPGFAAFEATAEVQIDSSTRVDIPLGVQGETTQVTVSGETPLLKVDRADVSTTLTTEELGNLPIIDRNLTFTMLITPGTQVNDWQHASSENPQGGYQIDANGQQFTSNGFLLDGTENNSSILGIAVINPNIDSLQEFKITTSNYDAQFGSVAGALMQATTKSGTNNFHGSAFEYLRNDYFNAKDWTSGQSLPLRWNQFGGSVGGPIRTNKVFFFADFQAMRRRRSASVQTTVPNSAERAGDLTALLGDYICGDKTSSASPCASPFTVMTTEGATVPARVGMVFDPTTGTLDPLTGVPTGRLAVSSGGQVNVFPSVSAQVTQLFSYLPMPQDDTSVSGNYIATGSEKFDSNQFDTRLDYAFSDRLHFFGRYTLADFSHSAPGAYGVEAGGPGLNGVFFAGNAPARNQSIAVGATLTLSSNIVTDFRFGFYRYRIRVNPNGVGTTPATDAGIPGLNLGTTETSGMPAFYVQGNAGFSFGYALGINQCNCPLKETENHFQWVNNWTMTKNNHSFQWGVDIRRAQQQRIPSDAHRSGEISFGEGPTGSPEVDAPNGNNVPSGPTGAGIASLFFGVPSSFSRYFTGLGYHPGLRQTRLFFYGQDSWRMTRKLTLNYGLRYENYLPQTAASPGGAGSFDPNTGEVLVAGVGSVPANMGVKAYNLGFAPRIGLAYQLMTHTVVRAGYGRSFTPSGLGAVFGQAPDYDPPVTIPQQLNQNNQYESVFDLFTGPPLPPNPPVGTNGRYPLPNGLNTYYFFNPPSAYRIPLADSWNLAVQHEITSTLTAEIAYVGNVGRHLFVNPNVNQAAPPDPNSDPSTWNDYDSRRLYFQKFGLEQGIYETCNCDNSSYHALQAKLQKRAAKGLDFLITYTYSKAMANSETGGAFSNNLNWWQDHGPANYDRTHTLTISHTWQLPYGRGRRWGSGIGRAMDVMLGGWDFSGISRFESGLPFSVFSDGPNLYADFNSIRPDQVGDPHVSNPSANLWFNPAAFIVPQAVGRNGDVHHNSLRGPRFGQMDLSLGKVFRITETKSLEFKWENYNALNHVNLANPNSYIGDPQNVGKIYAAADMRQMQFGLHLRF
jgi:hypothetical protein